MEHFEDESHSKREHITSLFKEFTNPSRLLQSFTNLSNTVIQTALSGQAKFVFEILQNADDAFEDPNKEIEVTFILQDDYFIVHHNGKSFDYNDVERICDYASQIEEVKATDLSKTGYKGLGFKSLFNLSDTIYIYSNGYSFRFDKTYWPDWQKKPWQIIPIWCQYEEIPLHQTYPPAHPVNIILKVQDVHQLDKQMRELITQPDLLLFLHRINKLSLNLKGEVHQLERKSETYGTFSLISFSDNKQSKGKWLTKTYVSSVPPGVKTSIQSTSRFIYPDKIKRAEEVPLTFAVLCDETMENISTIKGLVYSTLPTQLHLTLPYHLNSYFILNLDRSQLHENEWNEFLIHQVGSFQLYLLRDIAGINNVKNSVINIFRRKIDHSLSTFCRAYSKGYSEKRREVGWLPSHSSSRLLRLHEAWIDETEFFKQNFENIQDDCIFPHLIHYDLINSEFLTRYEDNVEFFDYPILFKNFKSRYFPQLTQSSYIDFIKYLHQKLKDFSPKSHVITKLKNAKLFKTKEGKLISISNALLEDKENTVPDFLQLNPLDNDYLPLTHSIMRWFVRLGAIKLISSKVIQESIIKWIIEGTLSRHLTLNNHVEIMNYLAKNMDQLTMQDTLILKDGLVILTLDSKGRLANECYFPDAVPIKEFANIIPKNKIISSAYDVKILKDFLIRVGVCEKLNTADIIRNSVLLWIQKNTIRNEITTGNYDFIIQYIASQYCTLEKELRIFEISQLKKMLVLTCDQTPQPAHLCFFDSAIPNIKGLHEAFPKNKLVSKNELSKRVYELFLKIGVSQVMDPTKLLEETVLSWIKNGNINDKITEDNHYQIIKYIADNWQQFYCWFILVKEDLKKIPVLTKHNSFRKLQDCYIPENKTTCKDIPELESVILKDEIVSPIYDSDSIQELLLNLGARQISFIKIYEKYSDHLDKKENIKWFFSELSTYWENCSRRVKHTSIFMYVQKKFTSSSCLLTKCGSMYASVSIYSSKFNFINDIVPNIIPLLPLENLPEGLEKWLGFKHELDLDCIEELIDALEKKERVGQRDLKIFYTTVLEQLRLKKAHKIKERGLKLLSVDYKFIPAECLNYFKEKEAVCELKSFYLKRIEGMSHEDTLELGRLCGVRILPFKRNIIRDNEELDDSLKQFYLERLPFIAIQESRRQNEKPSITLTRLYEVVRTIKLYKCQKIQVHYPFGLPIQTRDYFEDLNLYVSGKWTSKRTQIHKYLKNRLGVKNINYIIDMDLNEDVDEWLAIQEEDPQILHSIEEELKNLVKEDFFKNLFTKNKPKSRSGISGSQSLGKPKSKSGSHGKRKSRNGTSSSRSQISPLQSHDVPDDISLSQARIKWLGEMCVFHFLQDHYKDKYPDCRSQLIKGLFLLQWQSRTLQISWLNEKGDQNLPYDLVLEKDKDVKWIIKVKSVQSSIGDSFNMSHGDFIEKNNEACDDDNDESVRIEKHCLYNIFFPDVTCKENLEDVCRSYVLYKTVLHKNTSGE